MGTRRLKIFLWISFFFFVVLLVREICPDCLPQKSCLFTRNLFLYRKLDLYALCCCMIGCIMQHKFLCSNVQNRVCAQYDTSLDGSGEEQNSVPLCQIAYILRDFEWWLIFQMCSLIILWILCMHIYVHHLFFKLERNGAYPDGRGHVVTGGGKSFVLEKWMSCDCQALSRNQGIQFVLPDITSYLSYPVALQPYRVLADRAAAAGQRS